MDSALAETTGIPWKQNRLLACSLISLQLSQLFILPLALPDRPYLGLLLFPLIFASNTLWSLMHEAIHRLFHPNAVTNDRWGRILAIMFGVSLDIVKFGHLMHHKYNRNWESEWYDPKEKTWWQVAPGYYGKLFGGLYLIEIAASFLFLLPKKNLTKLIVKQAEGPLVHLQDIAQTTQHYFYRRNRLRNIREEAVAILIIYGLSASVYGVYWPWLAVMILGRAFTVSFMDNIYHYATPADNSIPAKELSMPRWLSISLLNSNYHHSHHRQANIAWNRLPLVRRKLNVAIQQSFWQAAYQQCLGPLPKDA